MIDPGLEEKTMLVSGRIEIEAPIVVLLATSRAGVPNMKANGKSR